MQVLNDILAIILISLSAYGFYHSIQVLRGSKLNFKPFNCAICISFWYSLIMVFIMTYQVAKIIVAVFTCVSLVHILKTIIDRSSKHDII